MTAPTLDLLRCWILPGTPDDLYGIDSRLSERKQARLNGMVPVRPYARRRAA
jgi:hypothetical protein